MQNQTGQAVPTAWSFFACGYPWKTEKSLQSIDRNPAIT